MSFQPLTKSELHDWDKPANAPYGFFHEDAVRSAVEGLKADMFDFYHEIGRATIWCASNDEVTDLCEAHALKLVDKWFPVFSQSHLNDSTYSSEERRPSGSSMTEPANLDAVAIELPCNPSRRVEPVTAHSHSLLPDQEVRDLNIPLEKGAATVSVATILEIIDLMASIDDNNQVWGHDTNLGDIDVLVDKIQNILSHSQAPENEPTEGISALASVKHGVPAGELKTESTSANGKDNSPKHAPSNGECICKHGGGAITKKLVEENKLCKCECHKNAGNTSYQNNKEGTR